MPVLTQSNSPAARRAEDVLRQEIGPAPVGAELRQLAAVVAVLEALEAVACYASAAGREIKAAAKRARRTSPRLRPANQRASIAPAAASTPSSQNR